MVRALITSAAVVSFLAFPALCVGGLISHTCDCAAASTCTSGTDCGHGTGCGHEDGCLDDPCSMQVIRTDRQGVEVLAVSQPAMSSAIALFVWAEPRSQMVCTGTYDSSGGGDLSFPFGHLPLLI